MFKNKLPALLLATALTLSPGVALAERNEREHGREHHFSLRFGFGPRHYANGYYDRWGYWHPYGFYDRWGHWHRY